MGKRLNGNLKWIVALIGLATILAGAVASHQIIGSETRWIDRLTTRGDSRLLLK